MTTGKFRHSHAETSTTAGVTAWRSLSRYLTCTLGGIAVSTAVGAPVLLGGVGLASDFAIFTMKKSKLQAAADAAALAATRELSVIQSGSSASTESAPMAMKSMAMASAVGGEPPPDDGPIGAIARSYVASAVGDGGGTISTSVEIDESTGTVKVVVTDSWQPFFAHFLGADITPIRTDAKAELVGESKVCVIATSTNGLGAISMTKNSHLDANGCSIYSNSTNSSGFYLGSGSTIKADLACSAGGVYNKGGTSSTDVLTDCPPLADPLAGRATPKVGACDYNKVSVSSGTVTLQPGVYCGGLTIKGTANVTLAEGDYIIKDGLFFVNDDAVVKGKNVAFYLTGLLSLIQFWGNATIDLSGAEDGDMAGLLFFEDPASGPFRFHNIRAAHAYNLTGTIYLPKGNLLVDPTANVAEKSAYTAIIAKRLIVDNGPSLVLNTNYGATKVPVPAGIRSSADVVLAE